MFTLGAGYTFLNATFQSEETVNGESNSTNDAAATGAKGLEGTIEIEPGDRIPLIPRHMLKAYVDLQVTSALSLNIDLVAVSSSYARGNENNSHQPDGTYYLGPGTSPGYAVVQSWRDVSSEAVAAIRSGRSTTSSTAATTPPASSDRVGIHRRPARSSRGRCRPINGEFPIRHGTFYAPGAPVRMTIGTRLKF